MKSTPDDEYCIYVGIHRPPWHTIRERYMADIRESKLPVIFGCPIGICMMPSMQNMGNVRDCWERGHYDVPLYCSLREMVEAGLPPMGNNEPAVKVSA